MTHASRAHASRYTGLMAGMIAKSIPDLQPSFEKFAQGLKAESEREAG